MNKDNRKCLCGTGNYCRKHLCYRVRGRVDKADEPGLRVAVAAAMRCGGGVLRMGKANSQGD